MLTIVVAITVWACWGVTPSARASRLMFVRTEGGADVSGVFVVVGSSDGGCVVDGTVCSGSVAGTVEVVEVVVEVLGGAGCVVVVVSITGATVVSGMVVSGRVV